MLCAFIMLEFLRSPVTVLAECGEDISNNVTTSVTMTVMFVCCSDITMVMFVCCSDITTVMFVCCSDITMVMFVCCSDITMVR